MFPSTTTKPKNQKQNHVKKKKKKPINEAIRANHNAMSICQNHRCATISTTNPLNLHSQTKQIPTQSSTPRHANPYKRPITILHADQCPRLATPPPDHHSLDHHDPPPKFSSKPTTKIK